MLFKSSIKHQTIISLLGLLLASIWIAGPSASSELMNPNYQKINPQSVVERQTSEAPETSPVKTGATFLKLIPVQTANKVYELESLAIDTDGVVPNPFDPAQMDIEVLFVVPSGQSVTVPAFWYQDFDPVTLKAKGKPGWRVRFTPSSPGEWTAQAHLIGTLLKSPILKFNVVDDVQKHGFVRVNSRNPRYLAFDDGSLYFPIGLNMAWSTGQVLKDYQRWMDLLSQNGGNFIRIWMAPRSFGIEWDDTGLGNYTARLRQAWLLDQVFDMAHQHGIYIILTLLNHGAFSQKADPEWSSNPYNVALGGPCQQPQDFVSNPLAKVYFSRRLRYIGSRWAYSTNLMAWEWWNEVDWTPISDKMLKPWIQDMSSALGTYDPYKHLVSNSYTGGVESGLWSMPEIGFAQIHEYSGSDPLNKFPSIYKRIKGVDLNKPVLVSEYGNPSRQDDIEYARDGVHLHNGLWAAPFAGFASTAMYWWWDQYVDPFNLWSQFRGIASFLKGENLAQLHPAKGSIDSLRASPLVLEGDARVLAWIRSNSYNMLSTRTAFTQASIFHPLGLDWRFNPPVQRNLVLTLNGLKDGNYIARWYSPQTSEWISESPAEVKNGQIALLIPDFDRDLALRLEMDR